MFGIGWAETVLILAVAVMVIGPKDLPRVLHGAGKLFKKVKGFTNDIQRSLDEIINEEELNEIVREANKIGGDNLNFEVEKQAAKEKMSQKYQEDNLDE